MFSGENKALQDHAKDLGLRIGPEKQTAKKKTEMAYSVAVGEDIR
jgi:hypothetical protein